MSFLNQKRFRSRIRKKKDDAEGQDILDKIAGFLDENTPELVFLLAALWKDQQRAITYRELRTAILNGHIDEGTIKAWQHDYTRFLVDKVAPSWTDAIKAGIPKAASSIEFFIFDPMEETIYNWVRSHGAEWVTNITATTREAITAMIHQATSGVWTVDELARVIRPTIGLTEPQARANLRYYRNMKTGLLKNNPGMGIEVAEKQAREAALKYAEKQLTYRAHMIAQTELAFTYNRGAEEAIRQAIKLGYMGRTVRIWRTAADEAVCSICGALNGVTIEMDEEFDFKGRELFAGQKQTPPAHPRCRCAVEYREIEPSEPATEI